MKTKTNKNTKQTKQALSWAGRGEFIRNLAKKCPTLKPAEAFDKINAKFPQSSRGRVVEMFKNALKLAKTA